MTTMTVTHNRLKVVYSGIYVAKPLVAGYPARSKKLVLQHLIGDELAIYIARQQVIIGIGRVTGRESYSPNSKWPYEVPFEWVIGPRPGITLQQAGLNLKMHQGVTAFTISQADMNQIRTLLGSQPDLDFESRQKLAKRWEPKS